MSYSNVVNGIIRIKNLIPCASFYLYLMALQDDFYQINLVFLLVRMLDMISVTSVSFLCYFLSMKNKG